MKTSHCVGKEYTILCGLLVNRKHKTRKLDESVCVWGGGGGGRGHFKGGRVGGRGRGEGFMHMYVTTTEGHIEVRGYYEHTCT